MKPPTDPQRPKIRKVSTESRRWKCGVLDAIIPELKPDELEYVEKVIKRVKRGGS